MSTLLKRPSDKVMCWYDNLDQTLQEKTFRGLYTHFSYGVPLFKDRLELERFEERVEIAHLQEEMKDMWKTKYSDELGLSIRSYLNNSIFICACLFYKCDHISLERVRAIHKIVCDYEPTTKTIATSTDTKESIEPNKMMGEEEYKERVSTLLHKIASLASKNKSLTEELLGTSLKTFAASLVKTQVEKKVLETLEKSLEFNATCSAIFEKYNKISAAQKEIISGLLNLSEPLKDKETWICAVINVCVKPDIKDKDDGLQQKVLEEFLKKI